ERLNVGNTELDRTLFQQAVGNLVENALAHTSAGGQVTVLLKQLASAFRVEVADTGRGLPEEHLPRLGWPRRGLAIVKSITACSGRARWIGRRKRPASP